MAKRARSKYVAKETVMAEQEPVNTQDIDRARALKDKVADSLGDGASLIRTPEEARKAALIHKIENGG